MSQSQERFDADQAFLTQVRAFLDQALTAPLREAGRATIGVYSDIAAGRVWQRRLYARGWAAPAWPSAFGGAGWSARQRHLFDTECARNDAPLLLAAGTRSVGPLLIEQGTELQRRRFLLPILRGETLWCQGFSEPGAGSDLAAIACRAQRHGDQYRLHGDKIWTTGAHLANWMFALVRTSDAGREGLTFLLLDMKSPGLRVAPIRGLAGEHEFNQVFFDDTPVPIDQRVGDEGDGWRVARRLMQLARSNNTPAAAVRRSLRQVRAASARYAPELGPRLAALEIELDAFEQMELVLLAQGRPGVGDDLAPSMLKLIGSELRQKIYELGVEALGPSCLALPADLAADVQDDEGLLERGSHALARYLAGRASTIYSGSSEIQRNILARRLIDSRM